MESDNRFETFYQQNSPSSQFRGNLGPRRQLSLMQKIVCYCNGSLLGQIGWAIFAFGSIFAWMFAGNADTNSIRYYNSQKQFTQAVVEGKESTYFSEGSEHNQRKIYKVLFTFTLNGKKESGVSFGSRRVPSKGEQVRVFYYDDNPSTATISDLRQKPFSAGVLFVLLFPLLGLGFLTHAFLKGRKIVNALQHGTFADAIYQDKEATNTTINKSRVYEYRYLLNGSFGEQIVAGRSHKANVFNQGDGATEKALYLPGQQEGAILLKSLPRSIKVSEAGGLSQGWGIMGLIFPAIALAINGYFLFG